MSDYYAVIDGQVEGPMTMDGLRQMASAGRITGYSQISHTGAPDDWFSWSPLHQPVARGSTSWTRPASTFVLTEVRVQLRRATAYPKLRTALELFIWLNVTVAIICAALCFGDSARLMIYLATTFGSVTTIVFLHVAFAFLDLVDAALRRDEGHGFHETYK